MTGIVTRAGAVLAAGCMVIVAGSGPALAGSGSVAVGGVQMSYTVPDRVSFDGPGCASIPWTLSWSKPDGFAFDWDLEARQQGSNTPADTDSDYEYSDAPSGVAAGTLCVDADTFDPARATSVGGTIVVWNRDRSRVGEATLTPAVVGIDRNRTRFARLRAKAGRTVSDLPVVEGRVVAQTVTQGSMGADGTLTIEAKVKGRWRTADASPSLDQFGRFSATLWNSVPKGMKVRVRLSGCGWCTNARSTTRAG